MPHVVVEPYQLGMEPHAVAELVKPFAMVAELVMPLAMAEPHDQLEIGPCAVAELV